MEPTQNASGCAEVTTKYKEECSSATTMMPVQVNSSQKPRNSQKTVT